jgi:molybdenum cofactor cytidylyltransferase
VPIAGRALPELLRAPRIFGAGIFQIHRGAAPLATNRDVGVVHGENCSVPSGGVATRHRRATRDWSAARDAGGVQTVIPGVVLAGGASSRMQGRPKALLPAGPGGETFLERIVSTLRAGGVDDVVVVTGHRPAPIVHRAALLRPMVRVVRNPHPERGQLSSLLAALEAVDRPGVRAMLVTLVDLPLISVATVRAVLDAYGRTGAPLVRPVRDGRHGHPVVFDRALFRELRQADPAGGAKPVVRAHAADECVVTVEDDGAFTDVDTPEDYRRCFGVPPPSPGADGRPGAG